MVDAVATRRFASLARRHPRRGDIPLLLIAAGALLTTGMMLPALETRTLFFWRQEYSIVMNVVDLEREGKRVAAVILGLCSIAYPVSKLLMLGYFWLMPFPHSWRFQVIRLLRLLGRWSFIDVLAVTAIVVCSLTIGPMDASPRVGLYLYAGGVLCLMIVTLLMDRLARHGA